jgi:hypothetical protein
MRTTKRLLYVAEPKHVREVTLVGAADFGFWSDYLRPEGLTPVRFADAAQIWVVAAEAVYLGIRYTEVSFSVRVALTRDPAVEGIRLLHAFTSSRAFAWCERTLFATPYVYGACRLSVQSPLSVRVDSGNDFVFNALMSPPKRSPIRASDERWEGPLFLPTRGPGAEHRLFFARLAGHTLIYQFGSDDHFTIAPLLGGGVLQPLVDSGFLPKEWVVRPDATHGRSRTYRRSDILLHDNAT